MTLRFRFHWIRRARESHIDINAMTKVSVSNYREKGLRIYRPLTGNTGAAPKTSSLGNHKR